MHARLVRARYRLADPERADVDSAAKKLFDVVTAVPGCRGFWAMSPVDETAEQERTAVLVSLWDSREQAEQLGEVLGAQSARFNEEHGIVPLALPEVEVFLALAGPAAESAGSNPDGDHARLSWWTVRVVDRARAEEFRTTRPAFPLIAALPGFRGVWGLDREADRESDEFTSGVLSFWQTREQAEQAGELIKPQLGPLIQQGGVEVTAPPKVELLTAHGRAL